MSVIRHFFMVWFYRTAMYPPVSQHFIQESDQLQVEFNIGYFSFVTLEYSCRSTSNLLMFSPGWDSAVRAQPQRFESQEFNLVWILPKRLQWGGDLPERIPKGGSWPKRVEGKRWTSCRVSGRPPGLWKAACRDGGPNQGWSGRGGEEDQRSKTPDERHCYGG